MTELLTVLGDTPEPSLPSASQFSPLYFDYPDETVVNLDPPRNLPIRSREQIIADVALIHAFGSKNRAQAAVDADIIRRLSAV